MSKEIKTIKSLPLISQVIHNDLCIACGACYESCQFDNIRPAYNQNRGVHEVEIVSSAQCMDCSMPCDRVCPSIQVDFIKATSILNRNNMKDEVPERDAWIKSVYLAYSLNYRDNGISSSGGAVRAMIDHSLTMGTPVICLAKDPHDGKLKPRLLSTPEEIQYVPGSIYNSVSFVGAIDILRKAPKPVMMVAIPCQLAGIKQYINDVEPELEKKIDIVCGIVCGWMYSDNSIEAFAKKKSIQGPIESVSYRGGDRIGKLKLTTNGEVHSFRRREFTKIKDLIDYQSSFSTDYNRLRCRVCEDHLNLLADVIAGDAWLQRTKNRKISIVATRTEKGDELILQMSATKRLCIEPASFKDLIESQSENLIYGFEARVLSTLLGEQGKLMPKFLFKDSNETINVSKMDKFKLLMESIRRSLVRKKYYTLYKYIYMFRRYRTILSFLIKRA